MMTVTMLPQSRPLTRDDLAALPGDGHRYELIDGALVVTPAPALRHQLMVGELYLLLRRTCPEGLVVLLAPFDVALAADTVLQPDLLVARRSDTTPRDLPTAPLLAIEVLSPNTRLIDLNLKRARYEAAGCAAYWVCDPERPAVTAWHLEGGVYVEVAHVVDDEVFAADRPYPLEVVPARLLG